MALPVPETIDGLTTAWFQAALAERAPRVAVRDARVTDIIEGTCTKIRFAMTYAPGGDAGLPPTIMAKGGFAPHSPMFLGMHETEMRYYRDIAPHVPFETPACYFAGLDPANGRSIVLIEDLDARQVAWLDALSPLGWRDVSVFVDALAALAAQHWGGEDFAPGQPLDWVITSYEREAADYIAHYLEPARWSDFIRLPRCACLPRALHDRDRMELALAQLAGRLDRQPLTLSHGDTHPGNLYLTADSRPGFFDAQPRRAPWVKDFAYHIVAALDIQDRRAWERPLLSRYLRKLRQVGIIDAPDFEEAWYDYRCEIAYGLFIFMINESHFQREEINTAYAARFGAAAIDHGSFDLLR